MNILDVNSKKQLRQFIKLPYQLYQNNPLWIPPLRIEQKNLFHPRKNIVLQKCPYQLFLAMDNGTCVGRAAAFIDIDYNAYWGEKTGFFGSFECINDSNVSKALLDHCETWLRKRGMESIRGPINFESQNWGFILDGFDTPPRIMAPFNPPYYNELMVQSQFEKAKDLYVFGSQVQKYIIPERFKRHKEMFIKKYNLSIRQVRKKNLIEDVRILLDLNNRSVVGNWGVAPVKMEEAENIANSLKDIIRTDLVLIIEANGKPIAFVIVLPEIFMALKGLNGRLLPFGIFKLLWRLKKINEFRFWALGIVKEYQRRGIDSLLYLAAYETLQNQRAYVEANYILEDNFAMKDAVTKLGMEKIRTYRIYEKNIESK
jgi:ribosomal protein S18 acetylase RimI-like enzyme